MVDPPPREAPVRVSELLSRSGDARTPSAELVELVYADLHRLAAARIRGLGPGQTLQPTALVHEAYLRLAGDSDPGWDGRTHFYRAAARAMRDIVIRSLEDRASLKRGGHFRRLDPEAALELSAKGPHPDAPAIHDALERLEREHPRTARVVTLSIYGGMTAEEISEALEVSTRTVERDWRFARAWFNTALGEDEGREAEER